MVRQQRIFTPEFKPEAVRLVKTSDKGLMQTVRDLGIDDSTLSHWCQQLSEKGPNAFPGSGH